MANSKDSIYSDQYTTYGLFENQYVLLSCSIKFADLFIYDSNKYEIGRICDYSHKFRGYNCSLRHKRKHTDGGYKAGRCVICKNEERLLQRNDKNASHSLTDEYTTYGSFINTATLIACNIDLSNSFKYDLSKYTLGTLCPNNHKFKGYNCSLRSITQGGKCATCLKEKQKSRREELNNTAYSDDYVTYGIFDHHTVLIACNLKLKDYFVYDSSKYEIGSVCHKNHKFRGHNCSLRRKAPQGTVGNCSICEHERYIKDTNPSNIFSSVPISLHSSIDFDTSRYELDCLCKREHKWKGFNYTLRRQRGSSLGECQECKNERNRNNPYRQSVLDTEKYHRWLANPRISESVAQIVIEQIKLHESEIDLDKYYLGRMCHRHHDWRNTGKSLRRMERGNCHECDNFHKEVNKDKNRERQKYKTWLARPKISPTVAELVAKSQREYDKRQKYNERCKEKNRKRYRERYRENPTKERIRQRIYKHANPDKIKNSDATRRDRVQKQNNNTINTDWLKKEYAQTNVCLYCGKKMIENQKSLDHLVPISKGGLHAIHNVVVCCRSCNYAKRDKDFAVWLEELSEKQKKKSTAVYKKKHGVSPLQGHLPLVFD